MRAVINSVVFHTLSWTDQIVRDARRGEVSRVTILLSGSGVNGYDWRLMLGPVALPSGVINGPIDLIVRAPPYIEDVTCEP